MTTRELLRKHVASGIEALPKEESKVQEYVPLTAPLATWWQQATPGTAYWRCSVPARHLPGQALRLHWSDLKELPSGEVVMPRHEGAAIYQFVGNATRALLMAHQQSQGIRVLMEVDDNYLDGALPIPGQKLNWTRKLDRSPEDRYSYQAHRKIVVWVDGMIVATPVLAERYAKVTQAPIYVCPNSVDLDDWPGPFEWQGRAGEPRNIGYAGSDSHVYDLSLVDRALDWAAHQGATLWKLGAKTVSWRYPHKLVPWADDLTEYRRNLQVLDVGLCPLKRHVWTDCKSDIKAIEYTLSGAVPIVQKAPPYSDWFDVVPVCETEKEWLKAVKWALRAPDDELREVWQRAYEFVLSRKLIEQNIDKWREAL